MKKILQVLANDKKNQATSGYQTYRTKFRLVAKTKVGTNSSAYISYS